MSKIFDEIESIYENASSPYPEGTLYKISYGKECIKATVSDKENIVVTEVIKVVLMINGETIPNKAVSFPVGTDDLQRVTVAMNKLLSSLKTKEIAPISLLVQRNNNSTIELEEVRFNGILIYDKTFKIKCDFKEDDGSFIRYVNYHPFLEKLHQQPAALDYIYYRYKIYLTRTKKLLVYAEHVHLNDIGECLFIDCDYKVCNDVAEVVGFTHALNKQDVIYLFYSRGEVRLREYNDI